MVALRGGGKAYTVCIVSISYCLVFYKTRLNVVSPCDLIFALEAF